uniref:Uncharacterized protein n=1 Tax=Timema poppense TaxID=170557 RepID=A0A7R9HBN6_TIMPO|nr:unnamed protein product [Timema poppensis]
MDPDCRADSRKNTFSEVSTLMMTKGTATVDKVVRLCLHGLGVRPELELQPTAIDFGTVQVVLSDVIFIIYWMDVDTTLRSATRQLYTPITLKSVGVIETRVLRLTNPCCLPLTYRYRKVACLEVKPAWVTLKANSALEVVVSVKPVNIGTVNTSLVLELLSPECPSTKDSKYVVVGHRTLTVSYNAPSVTILPKIVFNLGISPLRGNEVGFLTGDVRFDMDVPKPRGAMLRADLTETSPWPRLETCDVTERGEPEDRATWTGVKKGSWPNNRPPTTWPHYVVPKTEERPTKEQRSFGVRTESLARAREGLPDCPGVKGPVYYLDI